MHKGYIKLYRRLLESDEWVKEKFTRGQAWVDLIGLANHKPGLIRARGVRIDVQRGQVGWSEVALSKRWKWSRNKLRNWLKELQEIDHQIEQQKNNVCSLITILNYELYQGNGTANDTAEGQQTIQQKDSKRNTNKNEKKDKNEKNKEGCVFVLPDWVPQEPWNAYLEMRVRIRKPLTERAKDLAIQKLLTLKESGQDPTEVLNQSVFNSYQGLFPKKEYSDGKQTNDPRSDGPFSRFLREKTGTLED